jgi:lipopolysaccharide assembly protein A
MKVMSMLLMVAIFAFGLMFSIFNPGKVPFDYFFGQADIALSLLLLGVFVMGVVLGVSAMMLVLWREKHRSRRVSKQLHQAQKEVDNLRSVPITSG